MNVSGPLEKTGSLEIIPENCPLDPQGRLSISLDDHVSSPSSCGSPSGVAAAGAVGGAQALVGGRGGLASELLVMRSRPPGRGQEVKSYTCLPQVRMSSKTIF